MMNTTPNVQEKIKRIQEQVKISQKCQQIHKSEKLNFLETSLKIISKDQDSLQDVKMTPLDAPLILLDQIWRGIHSSEPAAEPPQKQPRVS